MFYFKACPKCRGDMYVDRDAYGSFRKCIQCGLIDEVEVRQPDVDRSKPQKVAA